MNSDQPDVWLDYIKPKSSQFEWVQSRIACYLRSSDAPNISASALNLLDLLTNEHCQVEDLERVISMDAGLTTRCLRASSSSFYGGRTIESIHQALMTIGVAEIRQIAFSIGVVNSISKFRIKVDWKKYWLHSLLVGRLTQIIAAAFRSVTGTEYLAGLLHDIGKLTIEQTFPKEFEMILLRSASLQCGHAVVERELLGLDHAQVGGAMCHVMHLSPHVQYAVLNHHDSFKDFSPIRSTPDKGFLAACVSMADSLANLCGANLDGAKNTPDWSELDSWKFLNQFFEVDFGLYLDLEHELLARPATIPRARAAETERKAISYHLYSTSGLHSQRGR
jgi:putative nucleotidyltransferase with HDIG domain